MNSSERLLQRLDGLISKGCIAAQHSLSERIYVQDQALAAGWRSQSLNFLTGLLGENAEYTSEFRNKTKTHFYANRVKDGSAILQSLKEDIENGYLQTYRQQLSAEFVGDLIEQAEHLHENGFYQAATSIAGAALESGLREVATSNGITLRGREDLNALSDKLKNGGVINELERKQMSFLIGVRNAADHAEFDDVSPNDVTRMVRDVRDLLAKHAT